MVEIIADGTTIILITEDQTMVGAKVDGDDD